jgi:hypothetical protein
MTILRPLSNDGSDLIDDEAELTFWTPEPGNAVDEDLEELYFKHLLVDDPETARLALVRISRALCAWTDEVASWRDATDPPLWCPGCGYWAGGEPCDDPDCTGETKDDQDEPCSFELQPANPPAVFLLTLLQAARDEGGELGA